MFFKYLVRVTKTNNTKECEVVMVAVNWITRHINENSQL